MTFVADAPLTAQDFTDLAASRGATPFRARKTAPIAARRLCRRTAVETRWNGAETVNAAFAGDWIATTLDQEGAALRDGEGALNRYAISAPSFAGRYAASEAGGVALTPWGRVFRSTVEVEALLIEEGFDIPAPWGERQRADRGYLILSEGQVFGNHADTFDSTYRAVEAKG